MDSAVNVPRWTPKPSTVRSPLKKPTARVDDELELPSMASDEDDKSLSMDTVPFPFSTGFAIDGHDHHHHPPLDSSGRYKTPSLDKIEMEATVGLINEDKKQQFSSNGRNGDGIFCTWKDLSVTVGDGKNGRRVILQGLTGYAQPGDVLCVMGPSGCGKSTLLDALAGIDMIIIIIIIFL